MNAVDRWVRRLTVGTVAAVTCVFVVTSAVSDGLAWPAWLGVGMLAATAAFCFVAAGGRSQTVASGAAAVVGALLPLLGSAGLAAGPAAYGSSVWYVAGDLVLILMLLWGGQAAGAWLVLAVLVVQTFLWGGLGALASTGVLALLILLAAVTAARTAIVRAEAALDETVAVEREAIEWRTLQDAYHREREARLASTAAVTVPMLQRIADGAGRLSDADRAECRLLEQTVRDEIRGRHLLNDAVREQVLAHRRRGATVQVNDDGGLDGEEGAAVDALLLQVAEALRDVTSDRIIIRTLPPGSALAVSVVATSTDPIAAALGLDDDDEIDLWLELPRPGRTASHR